MATTDHNPWERTGQPQTMSTIITDVVRKNVLDIQPQRILSLWPLFIIGALFAFFVSWTYLRYVVNIYEVKSSVVLENNKEMGALEAIYSTKDPLNDQIALLKSPTVAKRVVDQLNLNYHTLQKGQFKDRELFTEIKWSASGGATDKRNLLNFELRPNAKGFSWTMKNTSGKGTWGEECIIGGKKVLIQKTAKLSNEDLLNFFEYDAQSEAEQLSSNLVISSKNASNVVNISLQDPTPARAVAILNALIPAYSEEARISKSLSLQQSLKFIEERLIPVTAELDSIESSIMKFKVDMGLTMDGAKSKNAETQIVQYEDELEKIQFQRAKLAEAEKYMVNLTSKNGFSISTLVQPEIQSRIEQFNKFQLEKNRLSQILTDNNPRLSEANELLDKAKEAVQLEFAAYKNNVQKLENNIKAKLTKVRGSIIEFPDLENRLEKGKRMQGIKQSLYNMLLAAREDVSIKLAAISVETSILSAPKIPSKPISPKRDEIMLVSTLAGLLLPLFIVLMRELLNNKIVSKKQLQQMTNAPVLAEIDLATNVEEVIVVRDKDRSMIGEQFRSLRTNLGFYRKIDKTFYVLVSSSMSGEGKSFISANLAASFALLGNKVALLEFDLRKPKLRERFGLAPSGKGIVNVLLGEVKPETIIKSVMPDYHLDLMISGPIPPNPSELIAMPQMEILKQYLDTNYNVVIIDTPPFGLVTDAQLLESWADISLVVVRFMNTFREQVVEIEEARQSKLFNNMAVIFNGIKSAGYYGYHYGYYGKKRKSGYGYGYYTTNG